MQDRRRKIVSDVLCEIPHNSSLLRRKRYRERFDERKRNVVREQLAKLGPRGGPRVDLRRTILERMDEQRVTVAELAERLRFVPLVPPVPEQTPSDLLDSRTVRRRTLYDFLTGNSQNTSYRVVERCLEALGLEVVAKHSGSPEIDSEANKEY